MGKLGDNSSDKVRAAIRPPLQARGQEGAAKRPCPAAVARKRAGTTQAEGKVVRSADGLAQPSAVLRRGAKQQKKATAAKSKVFAASEPPAEVHGEAECLDSPNQESPCSSWFPPLFPISPFRLIQSYVLQTPAGFAFALRRKTPFALYLLLTVSAICSVPAISHWHSVNDAHHGSHAAYRADANETRRCPTQRHP